MTVTPPPVLKQSRAWPSWFTLLNLLVLLAVCVVVFAIVWPVFLSARVVSAGNICMANLERAACGELLYASDHDDRLPVASAWMDLTQVYTRGDDAFRCPDVAKVNPRAYGYAMNLALSGSRCEKVADPASAVLLFDSVLLARNACSGFYGLPDPPRHYGVNCVAFADGRVGRLTTPLAAEYGQDGRKRKAP